MTGLGIRPALRLALGIVALSALFACSTPSFVDSGKKSSSGASTDALTNEVVFKVDPSFADPMPDCVAVMPLTASSGISAKDAAAVRAAIYEHLAPRVREIPLGDVDRLAATPAALDCATIVEGTVTNYGTTFLGVVSHAGVGAKLRMRRLADGTVIWQGEHIASSVDGGLPLDPIGAVFSIVNAVTNVRGEQPARLTDDLARRLVSTIPPMKLPSLLDPGAAPKSVEASAADWFDRGRAAMKVNASDQAQTDFLRAVALDPKNAIYQDALGAAYARNGDPERALDAYRKAIALDGHDGFAWYNTAVLQFNAGHLDAAVEAFREAGAGYLAKGDRKSADEAADRLHEIAATLSPGDHT